MLTDRTRDVPLTDVSQTPVRPMELNADWEATYRENLTWVYRYVYGRVGNRHDAEDVTADVFMRALPRLKLGVPAPQLRAYLATTARTAVADHWRNAYDVDLLSDDQPDVATPTTRSDPRIEDNVRRANGLLARLPDRYRRVLELRFLQGYSLREAASALNVTISNIKVLQHRALRRAAELGVEDLA